MIDLSDYEMAERAAKQNVRDWRTIVGMSPLFWDGGAFPIRVESLREIPLVIDALNTKDGARVIRELGGLDAADIDGLADLTQDFLKMWKTVWCRRPLFLPLSRLIYTWAIYRKIIGLGTVSTILEIGPGDNYLGFLVAKDPSISHFGQIEVTQSLYILQSLIGSFAFQSGHRDFVCDTSEGDPWTISDAPVPPFSPRIRLAAGEERHRLYPWWQTPQAFERSYDLVMSNENLNEMTLDAFRFFTRNILRSLKPTGYLLMCGMGKTLGADVFNERWEILLGQGFRVLLAEQAFEKGGRFDAPNFLLVPPGHPDYGDAIPELSPRFKAADPRVRAMYGLDRPPGEVTTINDAFARVISVLKRKSATN